jgi:di/tripeptidase
VLCHLKSFAYLCGMDKEKLKEVLSIPSVYGEEKLVRDYIKNYAEENGIEHYIDNKGNIYLTKGSEKMTEGEFYPCVVSHMDTVHRGHHTLIEQDLRLDIVESIFEKEGGQTILTAKLPGTNTQTGIGGDDKCGVFVCLEMFEKFDVLKGAFFVEEEIGMKGSKEADPKFFTNVGYAIQFDAPSANWITETCSGVKIFDDEFKGLIKETLSKDGYTNFSYDPFTDVNQLSQKFNFNCLNLGCGYYRQHTNGEYVVVEEVEKSLMAGENLITQLGLDFYEHKKEIKSSNNGWSYWDDNDKGLEDEELMDMSENITDSVIEMITEGASRKKVQDFVYQYLEDNMYY